MKYINKFETTEAFEAAIEQLQELEHYIAYDAESDSISLKKPAAVPKTMKFVIKEEYLEFAQQLGVYPLIPRKDLYKSIKYNGVELLTASTPTPIQFEAPTLEYKFEELQSYIMDTESGSLNTDYVLTANEVLGIELSAITAGTEITLEVEFKDGLTSLCLLNCGGIGFGLTEVSSNLFEDCTSVTDFSGCFLDTIFAQATGSGSTLTSSCPIDKDGTPIYNRSGNGKSGYAVVTDSEMCFSYCTNMSDYNSIPYEWGGQYEFDESRAKTLTYSSDTTTIRLLYEIDNVEAIKIIEEDKAIPYEKLKEDANWSGGYDYTFQSSGEHEVKIILRPNATDFNNLFDGCSKLKSVQDGLFDNCPNVTSFTQAFDGCTSLQSIPSGLFDNCPNVTSFSNTFYGCSSLTSIPNDLFSTNTAVTSFAYTFYGCTNLTSPCPTDSDGTPIYNRSGEGKEGYAIVTATSNCFKNCTKMSDYTEIPYEWGGQYEFDESRAKTLTYTTSSNNSMVRLMSNTSGIEAIKIVEDNEVIGSKELSSNTLYTFKTSGIHDVKFIFKLDTTSFDYAFSGCTNLQTIGDSVFEGCSAVTSFNSTFYKCSGLISIGDSIFKGCSSVTSFDKTFSGCTNLQTIGDSVFEGCSSVTSFDKTFSGCTNLQTIGNSVFEGCSSVTSFTSTFNSCAKLQTIGDSVFKGCSSVTNFTNTFNSCAKLQTIGDSVFEGCSSVSGFSSTFYDCDKLTSIPNDLFSTNTAVTSFSSTFDGCSGLTSIPSDLFSTNTAVTSFTSTFNGCSGLTSIPSDLFSTNTAVTSFYNTFRYCSGLTSIPNNLFSTNTAVTSFNNTFSNCSGLTSIGDSVFKGCSSVTSFSETFYDCTKLQTIGNSVFEGCSSVTSFSYTFKYCRSLTSIGNSVFEGCSSVTSFDNIFSGWTNLQTIGDSVFKGCSSVTNFSGTFRYCRSLTSIGNSVFEGCSSVTNFSGTFNGCTNLQTIGDSVFEGCSSVSGFYSTFNQCSGLTSIPSDLFSTNTAVTSFYNTFSGCTNLTSVCPIDSDGTPIYNRSGEGKEGYAIVTASTSCFTNCTKMSDYTEIPSDWGGGKTA